MDELGAAALPTGTVTIVMTDVESSTGVWVRDPATARTMVDLHYRLLRTVVHRHGGVLPREQGEGDSAVAAFATAPGALAACLDLQTLLGAELPELAVRVGVHTGVLSVNVSGKYDGLTMIRCARVRNLGHGGQVLVTSSTAALAADELPPGCSLVDLGLHALKGLPGPERVFQLIHPSLPTGFPPLASSAGNVPRPVSSFVGRRAELAQLGALLRSERLVALVGPGGVGKTRLALAAVGGAESEFPGGAWWVELATAAPDRASVAAAIASSCGVNPSAASDLLPMLATRLGDVDTLLALDNCEHVVDAVADIVGGLLGACPQLRVLITSREPLGMPGEQRLRVDALSVPDASPTVDLLDWDATRLFVERARNVDPARITTGHDAELVGAICRRLEGMPLAIELAAARTASLDLGALEASLGETFLALGGARRGALARHATLAASIAWSHDLLAPDEQRALHRLAVFVGTFDLHAARRVLADVVPDAAGGLDLVARLVDKSLVQFDAATGRYRLLGEVREFAHERLQQADSAESASAYRAHTAWYAGVAERFGRAGLAMHEHDLAVDLDEVLLALERAMTWGEHDESYRLVVGLGARWHLLGRFDAMQRAATWVLGRSPADDSPEAWAAAVARLAYQAIGTGRADFEPVIGSARAIAEAAGDELTQLYLRYWPAVDDAYAGRLDTSEALLADARRLGVADLVMSLARNLVSVHAICGRVAAARRMGEVAVDVARSAGRTVESTESTHAFLAVVAAVSGDDEGARRWLAAGPFHGIVGRPNAALVHAVLAYWFGDATLAAVARDLLHGESHPINAAVNARTRWFLHLCDGDVAAAVDTVRDATAPLPLVHCYFTLLDAQLAAVLGDVNRALACLDEARPLVPADAPQLDVLVALAEARLANLRGDGSACAAHADRAARVATDAGLVRLVDEARALLATVA